MPINQCRLAPFSIAGPNLGPTDAQLFASAKLFCPHIAALLRFFGYTLSDVDCLADIQQPFYGYSLLIRVVPACVNAIDSRYGRQSLPLFLSSIALEIQRVALLSQLSPLSSSNSYDTAGVPWHAPRATSQWRGNGCGSPAAHTRPVPTVPDPAAQAIIKTSISPPFGFLPPPAGSPSRRGRHRRRHGPCGTTSQNRTAAAIACGWRGSPRHRTALPDPPRSRQVRRRVRDNPVPSLRRPEPRCAGRSRSRSTGPTGLR